MAKIRQLPPDLANQIAAGEVVERPASVVKELVENSIDAHATRVAVAVEMGGKKLIRIEDDGDGMDPDDARLSLERHATSKIVKADDLEAIRTMGFRGEALPSIASVSHFTLRTRTRDSESGTQIQVNGGAVAAVVDVGMAPGTIIEVADLFYNLPARRKFLKSDTAETTQVSRMMTQLALAHPRIGFTVNSGPRVLLRCPPVRTLEERFFQLYGERADLVPVHKDAGGLRVTGFIAALAEQGPTRGVQQYFVNARIVKDRTIAHAVIAAYAQATAKERSPEAHLFIEMPPEAVDVNVHPTKAEVRFHQQSVVHEVVRRAVAEALGSGPVPDLQLSGVAASVQTVNMSLPSLLSNWQKTTPYAGTSTTYPVGHHPGPWEIASPAAATTESMVSPVGTSSNPPLEQTTPQSAQDLIKPLIPLGQFRHTFIIAVDDDGVAVIDQHVAHERVLYERISQRLTSGTLDSQRLLTPILMDVPPDARAVLLSHGDELHRCGFDVEEFGPSSVRISSMPALLTRDQGTSALRAMAGELDGQASSNTVHEHLRQMAATMACHAAVKANDPLTHEKMVHILDELRATSYSTVCPHGRPVMLRLSRREIEKNFQRI